MCVCVCVSHKDHHPHTAPRLLWDHLLSPAAEWIPEEEDNPNKGNDSFAGMFFDWTNLTLNYWLMLRLYIIYIWYILRIKTIYDCICKAMKVVRDVVRPTWDESTWLNECIAPGFLLVFIDFSFASALQKDSKAEDKPLIWPQLRLVDMYDFLIHRRPTPFPLVPSSILSSRPTSSLSDLSVALINKVCDWVRSGNTVWGGHDILTLVCKCFGRRRHRWHNKKGNVGNFISQRRSEMVGILWRNPVTL